MKRIEALRYIGFVLDDSLNVLHHRNPTPHARLIGWKFEDEPVCVFVAVQSYLPGVVLTHEEAKEIAIDYLVEIDWFGKSGPRDPDYCI